MASWCHVDYAEAFYAAARIAGPKIREGLGVAQLQRIASRFKRRLVRVHWRRVDLEEDSGILGIKWNDRPIWADGHWVILRNGTIIDPDPTSYRVWEADLFMKHHKARPVTLLAEYRKIRETPNTLKPRKKRN